MSNPLIKKLLARGLIEPHPCGGIAINAISMNCQIKNKDVPGLYNIGPLNKGCLLSTNALWFNARCAEQWALNWAISRLSIHQKSVK